MADFAAASIVTPVSAETLTPDQRAILCKKAYDSEEILLSHTKNEIVNGDGKTWNFEFENKDLCLKVYNSETNGSTIKRFKAICFIKDTTPQKLIDFICDQKHRLTWDRNIANLETVAISNDSRGQVSFLRSCTKQVGPISGRDFIDVTIVKTREDGSIVNCGWGLSVDETCGLWSPTKQFVRGHNHPGTGWHIESDPSVNGVKVTYVIQTDLKGWFHPFIINQAIGGSYAAFFEDLQKALKEKLSS